MDREIIAEIRLAPGEVGYYDDYSRIYLSTAKPVAKIYAGMNTTQIRRSIRSGRLRLISGSLFGPAPKVEAEEPKKEKPIEVKVEEPIAEPEPEVIPEEPVIEPEPEVEEPAEEILNESVPEEEAKPKRRRSRKKTDAE